MKKFLLSNILSLFTCLFLFTFLIIVIQNSNQKRIVKFINIETIELPISFSLGSSFIAGSFFGNIIFSILNFKK